MTISLILFIVLPVFFAYRGYRQGFISSLSTIVSLAAAYLATILYTRSLSTIIIDQFDLQQIAALALASISLFICVYTITRLLLLITKRLLSKKVDKSLFSSVGGAMVGGTVGFIVAVIIVWAITFVRDSLEADNSISQNTQTDPVEQISGKIVGNTVAKLLNSDKSSDGMTNLGTAFFQSPAQMTRQLKRLADSNDLQQLFSNHHNQAVLSSGDVEAVKQLAEFQQLINNPDLLALGRSAGMLPEDSTDQQLIEQQLAEKTIDIWQRVQQVQDDPRVRNILDDADFRQKLQSGNPLQIMADSRLLQLADLILAEDRDSSRESKSQTQPEMPSAEVNNDKPPTEIYQWTDEDGRIHFSDKQNAY